MKLKNSARLNPVTLQAALSAWSAHGGDAISFAKVNTSSSSRLCNLLISPKTDLLCPNASTTFAAPASPFVWIMAVSYTHQCLPQIAATTHKGYPVVVLVDVMCINSWGSDFTLINVVHTNGLQDLSLSN
jgi:hypothetical protein